MDVIIWELRNFMKYRQLDFLSAFFEASLSMFLFLQKNSVNSLSIGKNIKNLVYLKLLYFKTSLEKMFQIKVLNITDLL